MEDLLKRGSTGLLVVELQKNLTELGYILKADGIFGPLTEAALKRFQEDHEVGQTGILGPQTTETLAKVLEDLRISPWMDWMRSHLGEHEVAGSGNNPFIVALFKHTTYKTNQDSTPWCAAAVSTALEETGYLSTRSAAALSYKNYGEACSLKPGCILVFGFQNGLHHVSFLDHWVGEHQIAALGGNQADSIKISTYAKRDILASRWPVLKK